jgi:N-acetylglucosaminyldiphosphoundecaprenol N-acetyl-beta-D-mannosaminyltransferase
MYVSETSGSRLDCEKRDRIKADRTDILGVGVSPINLADAVETIESWIKERDQNYVCVTGAHGVMECQHDARLRSVHNQAGMVTPDGMPLVWLSRLVGEHHMERVCGCDLMRAVTAVSEMRGYRQFYYGGGVGLAETLSRALIAAHPKLTIVGTHCPPFRELTPAEDEAVITEINAARPDIVWVGLSTPKQELWMASHLGRIDAPVMIGVGAAFDFLAGTRQRAPRWMQQSGLEWLHRVCCEPRRLWSRYAVIVPGFLFLAAGALTGYAIRRLRPASIEATSRPH